MKVYYFLSHLSFEDYKYVLAKIQFVSSSEDTDRLIEKYMHKIGEDNTHRTQKAAFMEVMVFIKNFLKNKYGKLQDIQWIYRKNFFLYNEEIYEYKNNSWQIIKGKTIFVTTRDSFRHPFFYFLETKKSRKQISVLKANGLRGWEYLDKLFFISKIWEYREKYIGNILIPFIMDPEERCISDLLDFVSQHIGNKSIIKDNFGVEGYNVKPIDYKHVSESLRNMSILINDFFPKSFYTSHASFFTPYYDIKKEFRIYYTFSNNTVQVYSIKNKTKFSKDERDISFLDSFSPDNIKTLWSYFPLSSYYLKKYGKLKKVVEQIVPILGLDIGVLELCELLDGSFRFIEVNPLGGTLMFPGEDEKYMKKYYIDMWDNLLK